MHFEGIGRVGTAVAVASALLVACGGGGGGSSSETAQAQRVVITQSNATPVAAEAIDAGGAGSGASGSLTGVQVSSTSAPVSAMTALANAVQRGLNTTAPSALVGATVTQACGGGGSITISSSNTQASLTFNSCVENGATATGTLSVTLVSGNTAIQFVADATASNFTITSAGLGERLNGTMRVSFDETSSTHALITITSSSLLFDRLLNGTARATRTLTNYNYYIDTTIATGSSSQTFSYTVSGSFPGFGTVSFDAQTTQPIITLSGAVHPSSGAGKVTGANGTSVTVTVISTGVRLDIDTNGDGVTDATLTRTWAELDAVL
jgi:hypothetical protein